jgi:hypothetical protein
MEAQKIVKEIIMTEKDIKRAIEEYLVNKAQGTIKAIRLEHGDNDISADPREYSDFYAKVEIETEVGSVQEYTHANASTVFDSDAY